MRQFRVLPAASCGTVLVSALAGGSYRRALPVIAGPRPEALARNLLRHMFEEVEPPPACVVRLTDATVRGPGIITLPGDVIVAESLINAAGIDPIGDLRRTGPGSFAAEPVFPGPTAAPAGPHVLLKQLWDVNYGHWLIESLPRMALLDGLDTARSWRFVVSSPDGMSPLCGPMRSVMADSLELFGVDRDRIMLSGWSPQFFGDLIYPLPLTLHPWVKAPLAVSTLEALARTAPAGGPVRVFARRPQSSRRRLRNEAEVAAVLQRRGYAAVMPAAMTFAEQLAAFAAARIVVGVLGAECSNLVFAPRGVRFVGLAPEHMQDDFFYDLVSHKQGRYFGLHGAAAGPDMNADFTIELPALEQMLDAAESGG